MLDQKSKCLSKIKFCQVSICFVYQISIFCQIFFKKSKFLSKIQIFVKKPKFLSQIQIFVTNPNFCQKSKSLSKKWNVCQESNFLSKNKNFVVQVIRINSTGESSAVGFNFGIIFLYNLPTGTCTGKLRGHDGDIQSFLWLHGKLISSAKDRTIKIWSIEDSKCCQTVKLPKPSGYKSKR